MADWMETQFKQVPRPSFSEIEERLRKTEFWPRILRVGRRTGKSSVHTWWLRWTADIARKRVAAEFAAAFNAGGGKDVLEIETAITGIANEALLEDIRQEIQHNKSVTERAATLIELHRRLQTSSARREAERRASGRAQRHALKQYSDEVVELLKSEPEAKKIVLDALARAQAEIKRKSGEEPEDNSPNEPPAQTA